ncbi:hypothetical protein ACFWPV_10045 [Streptomyces uncialis]|uniref:hypothetical protein n=1 Tax=Streptomyces uncialis TaxID=1048205 RepID=UPI003651FC4A
MATAAYLAIRCDGPPDGEPCGAETHTPHPVSTHSELRRIRRADGWRTRRRQGGGPLLDACPDCTGRTRSNTA